MEEMNKPHDHPVGAVSNCYGHGMHGWGHRYSLLRILLTLLILTIVFLMGYKLGELRGSIEGFYGPHRMMRYNVPFMYQGMPQGGMMYNTSTTSPVTQP